MTCANCGGTRKVALATPDLDIRPVPLCQLCRVLGLDWQKELGVKPRSMSEAKRVAVQKGTRSSE